VTSGAGAAGPPRYSITSSARASSDGGIFEAEHPRGLSVPGGFIADPLSSKALEHLIVARATTACGCGTVRVEKRGGARNDGLSMWAAPMDWNFLFLGRS
jgi:hypothetical protein